MLEGFDLPVKGGVLIPEGLDIRGELLVGGFLPPDLEQAPVAQDGAAHQREDGAEGQREEHPLPERDRLAFPPGGTAQGFPPPA